MDPLVKTSASLEPILEKVGRVLADQYGIRVVCQGTRCCTDGKVIYLPALPDDVPDELRDTIRGYVDHECGHLLAKSSFSVGAEFKRKHGAEAFGLLNSLEDLRVEAVMRSRYPGSAHNLTKAYGYAASLSIKRLEDGFTLPIMKQLAFAIYSRARGDADLPFVEPNVYALADRIGHEIKQSVTAPSTKAVAQLAESAWQTVQSYLGSSPSNQDQTRSEENRPDRKPSTAPASFDSDNACSDKANSSVSATGKKTRRKKESPPAPGTRDPSSGKPSNTISQDTKESQVMGGVIGGLGEDIAGAVSRYSDITQAYRVWSTSHDTVSVAEDNSTLTHSDRMASLTPHVAGVRQRLLQTLLSETRARWLPDMAEGHLNPRALHRIASVRVLTQQGKSGGGGVDLNTLTRRVFRKRVAAQRLRTAVVLLLDLSHSMNGRKLDITRGAAMILCEAMARLNIPVEVIGFATTHYGKLLKEAAVSTGISPEELEKHYRFAPLVHEFYKHFDEPFREVSGRFESMKTYMLTPIGESLLFAARRVAKRPEPRKVLMTLSDGRPCVGMDSDITTFNHAHDSIQRIERAGIDVCLIGILEACVRDLHHRSVVVDALENLPGTVMAQMQQLLSRGIQTAYRHACRGAA